MRSVPGLVSLTRLLSFASLFHFPLEHIQGFESVALAGRCFSLALLPMSMTMKDSQATISWWRWWWLLYLFVYILHCRSPGAPNSMFYILYFGRLGGLQVVLLGDKTFWGQRPARSQVLLTVVQLHILCSRLFLSQVCNWRSSAVSKDHVFLCNIWYWLFWRVGLGWVKYSNVPPQTF